MPHPPRPIKTEDSCALLQGTLVPVLDKLLEPGQALAGALTMPLHCGVGTLHMGALAMPLHCGVSTRSPTCTSVELGTASGLVLSQSKPGP